ncbi:MAG: NYN domain-containing protein [Nitrospirae bacterium]|uniref:NYN domain-containing protein n=1 Tax=Candidatus Magnetobacterium casense TaxID=1455061 RepID=UPI00058C985D|nr:NYN domain-containing protein [Candidatus Magnetobacterium casensis]MBF0338692.1 NYN domain-containing protein [Nitrospirota bacterium]
MVKKVDNDGKIIRTYWYVIEEIDFYPYKFPDADVYPDKLKNILIKEENLRNKLENLSGKAITDEMKKIVENLKKKQQEMLKRARGWSTLQNGISAKHKFIEFRKSGAIKYNLFNGELGEEKTVDVKLATDMIMLRDIYDIAVIVSGDQDYVPAVKVVKDSGKHVVNVSFETRGGKLLPGGAWRLNSITDWGLKIPYEEFHAFLNFV